MSWQEDWPFQRKLRFAIVVTTSIAMILACGVFLTFELFVYRGQLKRTIATLSRITAENSTAAIAFNDPARATGTLEALRAEPQIVAAILTGTDGRVVATYATGPEAGRPEIPALPAGVHVVAGRVVGVQPVIQGSHWLGTLYVWASMERMYRRMEFYAWVVLGVLTSSLLFAWFLSTGLRRSLARPILELANTVGAISSGQDFSLRARQYGRDELGRLTAAFNAMLERTESAVTALRASETQLRLITDNAPVFLSQCDRSYRYKFASRPNAARFGLEPHQMIGRTVSDIMGPLAFTAIQPHMDRALAGEHVEFEIELSYPLLGRRWMHVTYVPERTIDGEIIGLVGVMTDASQYKQVEHEVAQARDEALAASRAKDDFLAALSHELRTPLNPVLLLASESAQDPRIPAEVRTDFETIRKHVELEARLIDDLLDLTRITRGKLSLERKVIDVHAVLHDALATVQRDIADKKINLTLRQGAARHLVIGDAVRLQQVFWNVLKNAVKFTPEGGRISVQTATTADDGHIALRIVDSGIGLTPAELDKIFDAFSQGDHVGEGGGSHRFGGLGLGLAISRMVVEMHAGTIRAVSAGRGLGATFLVELPLAAATEADGRGTAGGRDRRLMEVLRPAVSLAPGRILLVEDHVPTRNVLERLLTRRQFQVATAGSLADARALAQSESFDLLISDVGLPDGNGYELMQELGGRHNLRGIALTGYGMEGDLTRSREAGFSAHLTKPVRVQSLDAALASIFGR